MRQLISSLDHRALEALYAIRDPAVAQIFIWISELGRSWTVYGLALCVALVLIVQRKYASAVALAISVTSAGICIVLIKGLMERARPPIEFQAYIEIWYSFPSAHMALAVALYGFLAVFAWNRMNGRAMRYGVLVLLSVLTLAIGFSRLYLGVHYLSDVIAGALVGTFSVWLGWKYAKIAGYGRI